MSITVEQFETFLAMFKAYLSKHYIEIAECEIDYNTPQLNMLLIESVYLDQGDIDSIIDWARERIEKGEVVTKDALIDNAVEDSWYEPAFVVPTSTLVEFAYEAGIDSIGFVRSVEESIQVALDYTAWAESCANYYGLALPRFYDLDISIDEYNENAKLRQFFENHSVNSFKKMTYKEFVDEVVSRYDDTDDLQSLIDATFDGIAKLKASTLNDLEASLNAANLSAAHQAEALSEISYDFEYIAIDNILYEVETN